LESFADLARLKKVAAVCRSALQRAEGLFGTRIPGSVHSALADASAFEPSAAYLGEGRLWHNELSLILQTLPSWPARARHLGGVMFPSAEYMRGAYGLNQTLLTTLLLPALYMHRNVNG